MGGESRRRGRDRRIDRRVGVGISSDRTGQPSGQIVTPPFAKTLPDNESDIGVENRAKEGRFDLFADISHKWDQDSRRERGSIVSKFTDIFGDESTVPDRVQAIVRGLKRVDLLALPSFKLEHG